MLGARHENSNVCLLGGFASRAGLYRDREVPGHVRHGDAVLDGQGPGDLLPDFLVASQTDRAPGDEVDGLVLSEGLDLSRDRRRIGRRQDGIGGSCLVRMLLPRLLVICVLLSGRGPG